jgi:hypothetical protein
MTPSPTSAPDGPAAAGVTQTPIQPIPSSRPQRPLRREGAVIILTPAEQAMEDAMERSSPAPEQVLGKRAREVDDPADGNDTEPDDGSPLTTLPQPEPSISNVLAATLRYMSKKKLRSEQRDEVDAFLLVSPPLTYLWCSCLNIG